MRQLFHCLEWYAGSKRVNCELPFTFGIVCFTFKVFLSKVLTPILFLTWLFFRFIIIHRFHRITFQNVINWVHSKSEIINFKIGVKNDMLLFRKTGFWKKKLNQALFRITITKNFPLFRMFTLYAKSLSLDVVSRVWDVFFRDGEEFLFRTALGRFYKDSICSFVVFQNPMFRGAVPITKFTSGPDKNSIHLGNPKEW